MFLGEVSGLGVVGVAAMQRGGIGRAASLLGVVGVAFVAGRRARGNIGRGWGVVG